MALAQAAIDEKMAKNVPKEDDDDSETPGETEQSFEDEGEEPDSDEVEFVRQGEDEDGDEYDQRLRRLLDR
jgi:hypothetical protein